MGTVAVAAGSRVELGTPGVSGVLPICARNSGPQKSRAVAGAEERPKIKEPPTRAMRCAGPKYLRARAKASGLLAQSSQSSQNRCSGMRLQENGRDN